MTDQVTFFWVPGTGESYAGDTRTDVLATNSMGSRVVEKFTSEITDSVWVGYDSSYGPVGGGTGGQSHHDSREIGKAALLAKARATQGYLIFGGYSQGAGVVWEVMQDVYKGKHPDLWPRIIGSLNMANPYRTKGWAGGHAVTLTTNGDLSAAGVGWGVANLLGSGLDPRIFELNLVNPNDMICNAKPDSFLRDVASLTDFMEKESLGPWINQVISDVINVDWENASKGWLDVPNQIRRLVNTAHELRGYMGGEHTCYGNSVDFPYPQIDGSTGSLAGYAGSFLAASVPAMINEALNRGPNPPLVAYEDFNVTSSGWTNFSGGSLSQARMASNRAGIVSTGTNVVVNAYGVHSAVAPSDDYEIEFTLADVLQGQLDKGSNGAAMYHRIRCTGTWGVGTAVEVMIRASGGLAIGSVNGGSVTTKQTGTGAFQLNHKLGLRAVGNVYTLRNKTTDSVLISWTDTAGLVTQGPQNRRGAMVQTSNHPLLQPQWSSYTADNWAMTDLSV